MTIGILIYAVCWAFISIKYYSFWTGILWPIYFLFWIFILIAYLFGARFGQ